MDLNNVLFPAPDYTADSITEYDGELTFIPKTGLNSSSSSVSSFKSNTTTTVSNAYIPCLLLISKYKTISNNFCIFFHGNAEDIFGAREIGEKIRANLQMNVIIVEYPGYSIYSEEKGSNKVLEDSLTVFDYLTNNLSISDDNIYVLGRSIGTSPALYLSSKRKPAGLFLMSPFTSIRAIAENLVGGVLKYLISER
jgi:hypothetical protein